MIVERPVPGGPLTAFWVGVGGGVGFDVTVGVAVGLTVGVGVTETVGVIFGTSGVIFIFPFFIPK